MSTQLTTKILWRLTKSLNLRKLLLTTPPLLLNKLRCILEEATIRKKLATATTTTTTTTTPKMQATSFSVPLDCATLYVFKLCHGAGVSLEFYDILFALLRNHSSKNKVDITKLPKPDTFLKSLRARVSSPTPIISPVGNLQVPHFDILLPNSWPPRIFCL